MTTTTDKHYDQVEMSMGMAEHDHDLVHELSNRIDAVHRVDQYITRAHDRPRLREFWEKVRDGEQAMVDRLRELIRKEIDDDCF